MKSPFQILALLVSLTLPFARLYAQDTTWIDTIGAEVFFFIDALVIFLAALALAVFLWGGVLFVLNASNQELRTKARKRMVWGIIGLFVIMVVWGIVELISILLGITSEDPLLPPQVSDAFIGF
jgi:hypothetical protein